MTEPLHPGSNPASPTKASEAASELNNVLQIISGASAMLDKAQDNPETYLQMLREAIQRAEVISADLNREVGGSTEQQPAKSELSKFKRMEKSSQPAPARETIMVVDDEPMTVILLKTILEEAGYTVATANSGFECLDLFRTNPLRYSLIMLDLTMPFLNGEETFQRLKEIRSDVSVVLCTGFIQSERLERMMSTGLAGFLRKPVPVEEVESTVRGILAKLRYSGGMNVRAVPAVS